jgi:hypothetical protein
MSAYLPRLPLLEDDLAEPGLITPKGFTPHDDALLQRRIGGKAVLHIE